MKHTNLPKLALIAAAIIGVTACNFENPADKLDKLLAEVEKRDYISTGTLSIDGELVVNGIKYDASGVTVSIDDQVADSSQLNDGMYVTVKGDIKSDGTGVAKEIAHESNIEGLVESNDVETSSILKVMGQTVVVDDDTHLYSKDPTISTIAGIPANTRIEVSGYDLSDGSFQATYIEVSDHSDYDYAEWELKGVVSGLTDNTFLIGATKISYANSQYEDFDNKVLANGMYVEVKSTDGFNESQELLASKIELESSSSDDSMPGSSSEMEFEGLITSDLNGNQLEVNGRTVILSTTTRFENGDASLLVSGKKVEVEVYLNNDGSYTATEISFRVKSGIELEGWLESMDTANGSVVISGQTFMINNATVFKQDDDYSNQHGQSFSINDLNVGYYVEVYYYTDANGKLVLSKIENKSSGDSDENSGDDNDGSYDMEIKGRIQSIDGNGLMVINSQTVDVSNLASFNFQVGQYVEVKVRNEDGMLRAVRIELED